MAAGQGNVRRVIDGKAGIERERLIGFRALEDGLFAQIGVVRAGDGMTVNLDRRLSTGEGSLCAGGIGAALAVRIRNKDGKAQKRRKKA